MRRPFGLPVAWLELAALATAVLLAAWAMTGPIADLIEATRLPWEGR